ncbi:MAG: type III pantothenate kinase [Proteobacteria bacterium]|nr:type III pantothenate kinase [Pseudomonadota bacterium]
MILCLDVGNSHIFGGVFEGDQIKMRFRYDTKQPHTSDQIGVFFRNVLRENNIEANQLRQIAIASVVPSVDYSLRSACIKYFDIEPFVLQAGVKTGLKIKTANPTEVGPDLIAEAIAGVHQHPGKNIIIVDFGTATTYLAVNDKQEFLGVTILPGFKTSMDALKNNAAALPEVEIIKTDIMLGRNTIQCIQAGLYFGQLAALKELTKGISQQCFGNAKPIIIGTGGFSYLFENENLFTHLEPDIVLRGLYLALLKNS